MNVCVCVCVVCFRSSVFLNVNYNQYRLTTGDQI